MRCWTFPGNEPDQKIIGTVKDNLGSWNLRRLVWVADRGFASAANRAYLAKGGGRYIHAEKLRHTNTEAAAALARQGRYHTVAGNLRVKEVWVPGKDAGARAERFAVCHNPEQAGRDAAARERLVAHLQGMIEGSGAWTKTKRDELIGSLKDKPGLRRFLRRFLRRTKTGLLRIDHGAIRREAVLDGTWLLRTNDETLTPEDLAAACKQLIAVERGWKDMKGALRLRPVFHHREDRIRAHVQLCWLALLLIRAAENAAGDTWRNLRCELDRMHLVTLATADGQAAQRSLTTEGQQAILRALDLRGPGCPKLRAAVRDVKKAGYGYVILDGTLIPIDLVAADRPFYSGKHKRHGMTCTSSPAHPASARVVDTRERPARDLENPPQAPLLPLARRAARQGHPRIADPRDKRRMKGSLLVTVPFWPALNGVSQALSVSDRYGPRPITSSAHGQVMGNPAVAR